MAGNYPDPPGYRLAFDRDGTRLYQVDASDVATEQETGTIQNLNSENTTSAGISHVYDNSPVVNEKVVLLFPQLMTITQLWIRGTVGSQQSVVEGSSDTTDGVDGAWTQIVAPFNLATGSPGRDYRLGPWTAVGVADLRAIRVRRSGGSGDTGARLSKLFVYGYPSEATDRLQFWDAVSDQAAPSNLLEWGDRPRNSTAPTRQLRVKNLSDDLRATAVRIAQETLYDAPTVSVPGQHQISKDGGVTWGAQQTIEDLEPGAISAEIILIRQTLDVAADLSIWASRVFAEANTWEVA